MKSLSLVCVLVLLSGSVLAQDPAPVPTLPAPAKAKKLKQPKPPKPAMPIAPPGTILQVQPDGSLVQVQLPAPQPQPQPITQTNGPTVAQIVPGVGPVTIQQPVSVTPTMVGHQVIYQPGVYATEAPKILPGGRGHIVYSAPGGGSIVTGNLTYNESDPRVIELALSAHRAPPPPVTVVIQKEAAPEPVANNYNIFKPCCPPGPMMLPPPPPAYVKPPCGFSKPAIRTW